MLKKKHKKPYAKRKFSRFAVSIVEELCGLPVGKLPRKFFNRLNRKHNQGRWK